ncbi:MAG: flagellar basal body P-ring formation chaperone FlgA [Rhodospirillales bacterium]|jgi:flagella basal body P-ring formation protein FlgA
MTLKRLFIGHGHAIFVRQFNGALAGVFIASLALAPFVHAAPKENISLNTVKHSKSNKLVTLKDVIIVERAHIFLGDLFTNVGNKAGIKIAYAPQPGKRAYFDAKWLYRVARAYGLKWRPLTLKTRATVERASQEIFHDEIEDAITASFQAQGYRDNFEVELSNRALKIHVAANEGVSIDVTGLSINKVTGRFVATLNIPANTPRAKQFRLTGRVHKLVQIPVVNRRLSRGEIILRKDIEWIAIRERNIRRGYIQNEDKIIGMAAKRYIAAQKPFTTAHIQRPQLVKKGDMVTISLISGAMRLKAQGRALETGSLGDLIRIKNTKSKRIVEANVTGAGSAKVSL